MQFDKNQCWYKQVCGRYDTNTCNQNCIRYMEIHYLMQKSGIPKNRQYYMALTPSKQDYSTFVQLQNIKENVISFVTNGMNLYIHSNNFGNGKTSWAIKIMQSWFDKKWAGNGFRCRGIFIHVPSFLVKIKQIINSSDEEFEFVLNNLIKVDLVIWDDIASTKLSDYDHANLLTYIDQRKLQVKSNIYTGNLSGSQLSQALGNRLASRVWNDSQTVEFFGADQRGLR